MTKKLVCLMMVLALLVSCMALASADEKRKVTIWYDGTEEVAAKKVEADYEALHPEIDIVFEIIPYADLSTKELVACQSSVGPDIMWQSYAWTNSFAQMGLLQSYNSYLADSTLDINKDFDPVTLELGTIDGEIYGLPWKTEAMCLIYNKGLFEEAGLDPEAPPKTWAEVIEYGKKLTKDLDGDGVIDQYGYGLVGNLTGNCWFRFVPELWSAGGEVSSEDMTEPTLNTPAGVEALSYYTGLMTTEKIAPEGSVNNASSDARTLFINGKVAMYVDGEAAYLNIKNAAPDLKIGAGLWPGKNGPLRAGLGGFYLATPKNAQNPDDAWDFIEYFLSPEVQSYFPQGFPGNLEARKSYQAQAPAFAEQIANVSNFQPLNDTPGAQAVVMNMIQNVLSGIMTVEEALEDADYQLYDILNP